VSRPKQNIAVVLEAGILNTVKGHSYISEFLRFCKEPYAIMMEHACLDITPFGVGKKLTTPGDFLHFIDAEFEIITRSPSQSN